jgi:hypothetical protein
MARVPHRVPVAFGSADLETMSTSEACTLVAKALHRAAAKRSMIARALSGQSQRNAAVVKDTRTSKPERFAATPPVVDWVLASGIFEFGSKAFFDTIVARSVCLAKKGFVFNMHETDDIFTRFSLLR